VPPLHTTAVRLHGPEQGPLLIISDARESDVSQDRPGGIEQNLPPRSRA
jgi:hypothetical protein